MRTKTRIYLLFITTLTLEVLFSQPIAIQADPLSYFLVGPRYGSPGLNQSYVLPVYDAKHLDEARNSLKLALTNRPIVAAKVRYGSDGLNRNYNDKAFPLWNWHVHELIGFGDAVIEVLDGKPSQLETGDQPWPVDSITIGFSGHTITKELGPYPLNMNITKITNSLNITWSTPGPNWIYTLEYAVKPEPDTNLLIWKSVPQINWPISTNSTYIPFLDETALFRVRASKTQ